MSENKSINYKPEKSKLKNNGYAKRIKLYRKIHKITGIYLAVFFLIITVSGILLAWKKDAGEIIQDNTRKGTSTQLNNWLSLDSLHKNAVIFLHDSVSPGLSPEINRIDARKNKGTVKFTFENHFYGIQLDGATGQLLHIEHRTADMIEKIHDGSIIDRLLNSSHETFKILYMTLTGTALTLLIISGGIIWYRVKKLRKRNNRFIRGVKTYTH